MENTPKKEVVSNVQQIENTKNVKSKSKDSQRTLIIILLVLVISLLGGLTYFFIKDGFLEIPFLTQDEISSEVTDEEGVDEELNVEETKYEDKEEASSTKFYIDDEDHYILEDNGWSVKAVYSVMNSYVDQEVKGYSLSCLWTIPENVVWTLEKDGVEFNIEKYYPAPNTCDGHPTTVGEGYKPLDYELNYTNSLGNKLYLMRNEDNGIYTYRFGSKNSLYDVRDGLEVYYPDIEYFNTGELYFIYEGNDTESVEAEILNLYENGGSGWWSWR